MIRKLFTVKLNIVFFSDNDDIFTHFSKSKLQVYNLKTFIKRLTKDIL